jgi:hypothetical protein
MTLLPIDAGERNAIPIGDGVLDYFPAALAEVARVSDAGNRQHNPGEPLGWSRWKSTNHWDKVIRHGLERGGLDSDGLRHSAKMVWRALAILQEEMEAAGAPTSRGSRFKAKAGELMYVPPTAETINNPVVGARLVS